MLFHVWQANLLVHFDFKTHGPGFVDLAKKIAFEIQSQKIGKTAALKLNAEMVKAHA